MTRHRELPAVLGAYALLVGICLYPQSLRPHDAVAYIGDSLDTVYFMAWNARQAFRDPLHLFDANLLHPHPEAMALAGHRILLGIVTAPVQWLTGNPILAYNVAAALGYLLAGFAGWRVARWLGLDAVGAFAGGAVYAFNSFMINEAPRADLLYHGLGSLALLALVRLLAEGGRRQAWWLAGLMLLQGLASSYLLMYAAFLLALTALVALAWRPRIAVLRLRPAVLPAVLAAIAFLPVLLPHVRASRTYGFTREAPVGIDLQHYVSTIPTNLVHGEIGLRVRPQQRGPHFVGFLTLAAAGAALVLHRRVRPPAESAPSPRQWVPAAVAMMALLVALSLGRTATVFGRELGPGPYLLVHHLVPGFSFMRIPERWAFFALLPLGLLAGLAVTLLRRRFGAAPAVVLAAALPLEHVSPLPLQDHMPTGGTVPAVYRWLATDRATAVAEVPVRGEGLVRKETVEEYFSTYHWKPIVHGYVSYPPLLTVLLRRMGEEFPSALATDVFTRVGVDTVVVHHGRAGRALHAELTAAVTEGRLAQVAAFGGAEAHLYESEKDEVYRVLPRPPRPPAGQPPDPPRRDPSWRWVAARGDAALAGDGDPKTAWTLLELRGDETLEVHFPGPLQVTGVSIPLRRDTPFPTSLRVEGRNPDGSWRRLGRLDDAHVLQLVDQLLVTPGTARLGFDLSGRAAVTGVRLLVGEGGRSFEGWSVPELEIHAR